MTYTATIRFKGGADVQTLFGVERIRYEGVCAIIVAASGKELVLPVADILTINIEPEE